MSIKGRLALLEARAIRREVDRIAQAYGLSAEEVLHEARRLLQLEPAELERQLASMAHGHEITAQTA